MSRANRIVSSLLELDAPEDEFDAREYLMADEAGPYGLIVQHLKDGHIEMSGKVGRHNSHYVHERSTSIELSVEQLDYNFASPEEESYLFKLIDKFEKDVDAKMVEWNKAIYRELESAYDWSVSDEVVEDNIISNEYEFTEDGEREDGTGIHYGELDDRAKKAAREWYTNDPSPDNYWAEPVIEAWKSCLTKKGFIDPEIQYSGFWSQGDGASFTARRIDFIEFITAPDLLVIREHIFESDLNEDEEEEFDAREDLLRDSLEELLYKLGYKPVANSEIWRKEVMSDGRYTHHYLAVIPELSQGEGQPATVYIEYQVYVQYKGLSFPWADRVPIKALPEVLPLLAGGVETAMGMGFDLKTMNKVMSELAKPYR